MESFVTVAELLQSGLASDGVLSLQHDVPPTDGLGARDDDGQGVAPIENAARIALLLARSFVAFADGLRSQVTSREELLRSLSTLQLEDFFAGIRDDAPQASSSDCNVADGVLHKRSATLLEIKILAPMRVNSPRDQQLEMQERQRRPSPLQILGKLLLPIFSLGRSFPADLLETSGQASTQNGHDSEHQSSKKNFRATDTSLFSRLVESEAFPISVSRLLSDLIDTGRGGKAYTPFNALEDVVTDLEQMTSFPQMFLHDQKYPQGVPQPPVFGQVYHGRQEEISTLLNLAVQMEQSANGQEDGGECSRTGLESVFVLGLAGSGKSHLVQTVTDHLSCLGSWIVTKAKFERGTESHNSWSIISSMFDKVISELVRMKSGENPCEVDYCNRASKSILDSIGISDLSRMAVFLPSLPLLFDDIDRSSMSPLVGDAQMSNRQLILGLSTILEATLESDRFIIMCCDDLQWAHKASLVLIAEFLVHIGNNKHLNRRCLFVGLYREDEVSDEHPFSVQKQYLQTSGSINMSEVKLTSLSKDDVADMLTMEFQLPRRLVMKLAELVFKKTAGHAYFCIELLNSLLSDSAIAWSSVQRRFAWDLVRIELIQTGDSVAELIARNFSSMPIESQRLLHILSCFGIQTDDTLLQLLDQYQSGILASTASNGTFVEKGILDRAGPVVIFTHDLIQEAIYESMSLEQRHCLHLEIGIFLGEISVFDDTVSASRGTGQLQLNERDFFAGRSLTSPLIAIACDQINAAGPGTVSDENQRMRFSEWNLSAGQKSLKRSNYSAAQYYFSHGILFLGEECWGLDHQLSLELHEGAVQSSFALGEEDTVAQFAEEVIKQVPFEDSLETQRILLISLTQAGKHEECLAKGVELLRQLHFNLPPSPNRESVTQAMASANSVASQYSGAQIISMCDNAIDEQVLSIIRIMDAFHRAAYTLTSPFLPIITAELVKYSLSFGAVCQDAMTAFASYGMFKISLEGDYRAGKFWSEVVRAIHEKYRARKKSTSARMLTFAARSLMLLYVTIDIFFKSPREIAPNFLEYHQNALKTGRTDLAFMALRMAWRYKLLGGENLSIIYQGSTERMEKFVEHRGKNPARFALLDSVLLFDLMGKNNLEEHFSLVSDSIHNMNALQSEAESTKNVRLLHHIHVYNMILQFWRDDFIAAEESDKKAMGFPMAKKPELMLIYHTFFRGLIALRLYRDHGGQNRLKEGREMMDKLRNWTFVTKALFENKWLLMKAEYNASFQGSDDVTHQYIASISAARDHGNIHEMALAYELLGNHCDARGCTDDAKSSYSNAYVCYMQWGALALANKLMHKHKLDKNGPVANGTLPQAAEKPRRAREWG